MDSLDTRLIALDWGTSCLRAYLLGTGGADLEARRSDGGIMALREGGAAAFERAFAGICGDWVAAAPGVPVVACGMVGSAQGWCEVPYVEVPCPLDRIAAGLVAHTAGGGGRIHIVPGLLQRATLPEVMRGEETQVVGALRALPSPAARRVIGLPGTHSKWVTVEGERIVGFRTFMTGEVYDLLCRHSLLGRTQRQPPAPDLAAFDRGVDVTLTEEARAGVLSNIFSARTLGLVGALRDTEQADYLSGLLIGHELASLEQLPGIDLAGGVVLAGSEHLCERYRRALAARGRAAEVVRRATERGLWALAVRAGLVEAGSQPAPEGLPC